ncbi:PAAR domain-containing protein [Paraburkholderia sp. J67]|uniref:PAAR domain-containing protein n=1 Tax=Paraburkholderia sp. J67 TaxID=2805435 RepID=UPI002ABE95C0|nr:PAAR domain-containing protein [Paraburkholderia sp. J67]
MRDNTTGRDMALQGDITDHGGKIIDGAPDRTHMGRSVALEGHRVACPTCGGEFHIIATSENTHGGRRIAYLGDKTTCGATLQKAST